MSAISDTWERGNPYERYVGRWSRQVAPLFLAWLDVPPEKRWLDVGCGTGALCAAIATFARPSSVTGVEPSAGFLQSAKENLGSGVLLHQGSAESLPLPTGSVDAAISGLVLNFVPDLPAALREMRRVTVADGIVAAYVWDYQDGMQLIRYFWDAAVELDPAARALHEGARFPLCSPSALTTAFKEAGLKEVATTAVEVPTRFESVADYWAPFLGGQGPAPAYAMSLTEERRDQLRARLAERLPIQPDGTLSLVARAWAVRGTATSGV